MDTRLFDNRVVRRIFGPRKDEVIGGYRRLHNEELCDLFSSLNILRASKSRRMRWTGYVPRYGDSRGAYRGLVGRRGGMMPSDRPRPRWEDTFKMNQEVGWGCGLDRAGSG